MKMNNDTRRILRIIIPAVFTVLGAIAGYLYSSKVGCVTGACVIMSNPVVFTIYSGVIGFLIGSIFAPKDKVATSDTNQSDGE